MNVSDIFSASYIRETIILVHLANIKRSRMKTSDSTLIMELQMTPLLTAKSVRNRRVTEHFLLLVFVHLPACYCDACVEWFATLPNKISINYASSCLQRMFSLIM